MLLIAIALTAALQQSVNSRSSMQQTVHSRSSVDRRAAFGLGLIGMLPALPDAADAAMLPICTDEKVSGCRKPYKFSYMGGRGGDLTAKNKYASGMGGSEEKSAKLKAKIAKARADQEEMKSRRQLMQLRGGATGADGADDSTARAEIIAKFNQFPTFCVVNAEDNVIGTPNADGGYDVVWFVSLQEAQDLLALMVASSEEEDPGLKLGCTPLGNAYMICAGWTDHQSEDGQALYKLQGPRAVLADGVEATLRSQLAQKGLGEDASTARWLVPVFLHDDFQVRCHLRPSSTFRDLFLDLLPSSCARLMVQTDSLMPLFFSADELVNGWIANGRPVDEAPEQPLMMDLRMLVLAMQQDPALRAKAQLVPTKEAFAMAKAMAEAAAKERDGGDAS